MTIKQQYAKQRRRIKSLIYRYNKRGYEVNFELPSIPKRITKASVRRLENITPKYLQEKTRYVDTETGEILPFHTGERRRREKRRKQSKANVATEAYVPHEYELAIDRVYAIIEDYPERMYRLFMSKLSSAISVYGGEAVGTALASMIKSGEIVAPSEAYNYEAVMEMSNSLMKYLSFTEDEIDHARADILEMYESNEEYNGEFEEW